MIELRAILPLSLAAEPYLPHLEAAAERYDIDTPIRLAHWLAQIAHESGNFKSVRESLNYTPQALQSLFGRHRIGIADTLQYGRTAEHPANQKKLADILYGGNFGLSNLGNTKPGDGSRYLGRGLKQLTGRTNYARCSKALYGDDRLVQAPELLELPEAAALSAGWFWDSIKATPLADEDDCTTITRRINGGLNGLYERQDWVRRYKGVL